MSGPRLLSTIEVWVFDPPELVEREWHPERGKYAVHQLHRTVGERGVHVNVKGVPLTKTGKPNGTIDWRTIPDADLARLHQLVLAQREALS